MQFEVIQGNNIDILKNHADNSVDSIVTDPPYGINFLGKAWDANTGALETYQECLRVLKPGGHILAFSAAKTYHHLAVTLEQAGFEIRDQIMWIYSSGFPKSQDIGKSIQRSMGVKEKKAIPKEQQTKTAGFANNGAQEKDAWSGETTVCTDPEALQWQGWGTNLKPAHEPICLARKPMKMSIAKNCQTWGVGALNIDATRIPTDEVIVCGAGNADTFNNFNAENNVDGPGTGVKINKDVEKWQQAVGGRFPSNVLGEIPDYQKYFYCPKVSRKERHIGFEMPPPMFGGVQGCYDENGQRYAVELDKRTGNVGNNHPTVKPVALMEYLIKLITAPGGTVLDPFCGSGSTGMAAVQLGHKFIGCELDPAYVNIARTRIAAWNIKEDSKLNNNWFEEKI